MARRRSFQHFRAGAENAADPRPHPRSARAARCVGQRRSRRSTKPKSPKPRAGSSRKASKPIAVCFLFAYANPAHEQAAAKIIRDIAPRPLCFALARGQSGMARIRAHRLDRRQRLYRSAGLALSARAGRAFAAALSAFARADDEIRRRRRQRPHAHAHADRDGDVRPGRRRHRRPLSRRHQGHRQHHHLRYRRHLFRHGGAAGTAAVQIGILGGAASVAHPHGRYRDHRRRRRQHRRGRSRRAQGRPAERRRRSWARLLRSRRRRADADRRARRAWPSQPDGAA